MLRLGGEGSPIAPLPNPITEANTRLKRNNTSLGDYHLSPNLSKVSKHGIYMQIIPKHRDRDNMRVGICVALHWPTNVMSKYPPYASSEAANE